MLNSSLRSNTTQSDLRVNEFYVVLVIFVLINCISLGRITGPNGGSGCPVLWPWQPGAGRRVSGRPGAAILFAACFALLLVANTLLTVLATVASEQVSGTAPAPWLTMCLSAVTASLVLLPLTAWLRQRHRVSHDRLRWLLPVAGIEVAILTTLLLLAYAGQPFWSALPGVLLWSLCAGAGGFVVIMAFADIRLRLRVSDAPKNWRGLPLELVTAGILALALLSPAGGVA